MKRTALTKWKLKGLYPYWEDLYSTEKTEYIKRGIFGEMDATVPGSVYSELVREGYIKDPYYGMNSLACEWVANRWWTYTTTFSADVFTEENSAKYLYIGGIDNLATVYLNGNRIERYEGSNFPREWEITPYLQKENTLKIVIESEQLEASQLCQTSKISTQRARAGYKWDFCVRLVNVGIYGKVELIERGAVSLQDCKIDGRLTGEDADVTVSAKLCNRKAGTYTIRIDAHESGRLVKSEEVKASLTEGETNFVHSFGLSGVRRWNVNGKGAQNLYVVTVTVYAEKEVSDQYRCRYGFRELEWIQNPGGPQGALPYLCTVNKAEVYIKGANVVPVDLMYKSGTGRSRELVRLAAEGGFNLLRVWGGGYFGDEEFYNACDDYGILVWQDFIQSSSGVDSIPNCDEEYLKHLRQVSERAVKDLRNHASLAVWCGGNELKAEDNYTPVTEKNPNIAMLAEIVHRLDAGRMFYPSTPSGPNFNLKYGDKGNNHNIHGLYKFYIGEDGWWFYPHYNRSDSLFHAEFGVDGVANEEMLKKILPQESLRVTDAAEDYVWRHLGDFWDTKKRDETFFGKLFHLKDYVFASQFIQAEGCRYAVESNRRRLYQNSGSILWQLNEPSPNASCTSLIGYDSIPKLAYYSLKSAFRPVMGSVRYAKLDYALGEEISLEFYLINEGTEPQTVQVIATADGKDRIYDRTFSTNTCKGVEKLGTYSVKNTFEYGLRIDMICGETTNSVLQLSRGKRGHCDLLYVKKQNLWKP